MEKTTNPRISLEISSWNTNPKSLQSSGDCEAVGPHIFRTTSHQQVEQPERLSEPSLGRVHHKKGIQR